ncbi:MAG: hypothetical protein ABW047_01605 [Nitrospiraceae bacterium]
MDEYVKTGLDRKRPGAWSCLSAVPCCWPLLMLGLLIGSLPIGCSPDSQHDSSNIPVTDPNVNHHPSIRSVTISPNPLVLNGPLLAEVDAQDQDGNVLGFQYRWLVNGNVLRQVTTRSITPDLLRRGDRVSVEVVASDGQTESPAYVTDPVVVVNTSPIVNRVIVELEPPAVQGLMKAKVDAIDPDGDEIQYLFRWWRNDKLVKEGADNTIDTENFSRKDSIVVEVLAHDQEGSGVPYKSAPVTVGNASPQILSKPTPLLNQGVYDYHVEAKDSDGDSLFYRLDIAPPGMAIDRTSGQIMWNIASDSSGIHRIKVVVEDGQGGEAWQEFEISVPSNDQSPLSKASRG